MYNFYLYKLCIFLQIVLNLSFITGFDYCSAEEKYCNGLRHIGCHPEQLPSKTNNYKLCPITRKVRGILLHSHNKHRNEIACGGFIKDSEGVPYPAASRMRELKWDYELEYLADVHVSKCNFKHDECHSTDRYPHSGQNLASTTTSGGLSDEPTISFLERKVKEWYEEYSNGSYKIIEFYQKLPATKMGHFTVLVNDQVESVGCAMALCVLDGDRYLQSLTCNYSYTNMRKESSYQQGAAVTNCTEFGVGRSSTYECLCESS